MTVVTVATTATATTTKTMGATVMLVTKVTAKKTEAERGSDDNGGRIFMALWLDGAV